ncbi:MAG: hypothetical protein KKC79_09625 [Gammaproteobacteria bacterium]|nr:hypothetical protein [Gammaproteobacteria bacterium]
MIHIADALKINRSLRTLVLHHSNLNERGIIKALCALLPSSHLSDIDLSDGELDDAACADLLNALKKNSKLKTLILQGNRMKAGACDAAGALLKVNNTLKKLDVSSCQIDDLSLTALTRHLSRGTFKGLMRLNMSWNEIGNGGLPSLLRALDCQQTLVLCAIGHNPFDLASPQVREQFDQAIKKSSSLTSLDYHNFKGAKLHDWSTVSQRLQANACLSNASTQEYLRELIDRFAFETLTIREVGEQIWKQLRDDPNVDDRYAHLRSILRLNEVCRGIAFGSGSHGFELESAEERASALIEARHAEGLESPTADSTAHPTAPLHDQ